MDVKQHALSEYKENNLKIKKYFLQSIATEWDPDRQGKQGILGTWLALSTWNIWRPHPV